MNMPICSSCKLTCSSRKSIRNSCNEKVDDLTYAGSKEIICSRDYDVTIGGVTNKSL